MVLQAFMMKSKGMNKETPVQWVLQTLSGVIREEEKKKTERSVLLSQNRATPRSLALWGAADVTLNMATILRVF
jgi:hypothetical protein